MIRVFFICLISGLLIAHNCFGDDNTSYKILSERNVDAQGGLIKRQAIRIGIPEGRTRKEVEETLKRAVKEIVMSQKNLKALSVQGFRPQDDYKTGAYTVGEAIYAPNGKWGDAAKTAPMKTVITLGKLYFEPKKVLFEKGAIIETVSKDGKDIEVFKTQGNWTDDNILMHVKPGQTGKILDLKTTIYSPEMSDTEYQIEINGKVGWTNERNIKTSGQ